MEPGPAPGRHASAVHLQAATADAGAPRLIERPHLVDRLTRAVQCRLTTIVAPAGFGKTSLVDQWAGRHADARIAIARFQKSDDRRRALERVTAAVRQLDRTIDDPGHEQPLGTAGTLDDALALAGPGILVLDGIDLPTPALLQADLEYLLAHAPQELRIVVTSRSRRELAPLLADRRAVARLTQRELVFTRAECEQVMLAAGAQPTERQLSALMATTKGWCAGVSLAAMGARRAGDCGSYLAGFGGGDRDVAALFRTEVLHGLPPADMHFLMATAPLPHLTAPLCEEVTGDRGSANRLAHFEQAGLFTSRRPGSGGRFAYHPMFRQFLRHELRVAHPEDDADVLRRAARWFSRNGRPEPAARCLIEAGAGRELLALADQWAAEMLDDGRAPAVLAWLASAPGGADEVETALRSAMVRTALGSFDHAAELIRDVDVPGLSRPQELAIKALQAILAFYTSSPEQARAAIDAAVRDFERTAPDDEPRLLGVAWAPVLSALAAVSRARTLWLAGDFVGGRELLAPIASAAPGLRERLLARSTLALLEAWAGNLSAAGREAGRVLATARRHGLLDHPAIIDAQVAAAHVHRERGALQPAAELLDSAYWTVVRAPQPTTYAYYSLERALWYLAAGRPAQGLAVVEGCYDAAAAAPAWRRALACLRPAEVQLLVALGRPDHAEGVLDRPMGGPRSAQLKAAGVQAALARGDALEAATRLKGWSINDPEPDERLRRALWAAIVDFEVGRRRQAVDGLLAAAEEAEEEGYLRVFLDAGPLAERLLRAALLGQPRPYVSKIVHASRAQREPTASVVLSDRELEVVRYLPTPLSNRDIAARLYISRNTVKTHLQAIYAKLGVADRREAIKVVQDLGLA
jgi:LuxR family maltose regulon positive regulatory protein